MDKHRQALQQLLPQGFAWPRDPSSTLQRLLGGMSDLFAETDAVISQATVEWLPHVTKTRLAEWEAALGLPDGCLQEQPQTREERTSAVLLRLRGLRGFYEDSSPAAPDTVAAVCAQHGYEARVRYNYPFRCGRDRVGSPVGQLDGRLNLVLEGPNRLMRCGDRTGTRLEVRPPGAVTLGCYLKSALPARYELRLNFIEGSLGERFRVGRNRVGDRLFHRTIS